MERGESEKGKNTFGSIVSCASQSVEMETRSHIRQGSGYS